MNARIIYAAGLFVLIGGLQFLVGQSESGVAVVASALLLAFLPFGFWALLEKEEGEDSGLKLPAMAGVAGVLAGGALRWATSSSEMMYADLLAALLCAVCGIAVLLARARHERGRCQLLCGRPLAERSRRCPRCEKLICGRSSCWRSERYRCAYCERLRRPLFPADDDEDWWQATLGRKVSHGSCQRCGCHVGNCSLYDCGDCQWPMCTGCWDSENGRCVRCGWTLPGLPEDLLAHLEGRDDWAAGRARLRGRGVTPPQPVASRVGGRGRRGADSTGTD